MSFALQITLAVSLVLSFAPARSLASENPPRPLYYEREISQADLEGRTLRELTLMRNWIYARAGNPFVKPWLKEFFAKQPWYSPEQTYDQDKISEIDRKNLGAIAGYEASITRKELVERIDALKAMGLESTEDRVENQLLSARLGRADPEALDDDIGGIDPALLYKEIQPEDIKEFSRRDLRIFRNMIYARHGRPFKSESLKGYFGVLEWYTPDAKYTDARLTPIDRKNIQTILTAENKFGGPLREGERELLEEP